MKKTLTFAGLIAVTLMLAGCAGVASYDGFSAPMGGAIFTEMKMAGYVQEPSSSDYEIVKRNVVSTAEATSYFMCVATGDLSYENLKKQALAQVAGADDLIDVVIDYNQKNVIGINTVQATLTGTAIKYNK